jgi:hypothetical protein
VVLFIYTYSVIAGILHTSERSSRSLFQPWTNLSVFTVGKGDTVAKITAPRGFTFAKKIVKCKDTVL